MPRVARLDAVGVLHHVMVRGIEKRDIFLDDQDRKSFLDRLSKLLISTETSCLAWSLMTNHFHLLLRPQKQKLSFLMRRLLTGYAVSFNKRHRRVGHLFQNRYKSIVCEEEPYLLELVRYIHLNPIRAGLVADMTALDRYPWTGHAVLLGQSELGGQGTSEVLGRFGISYGEARTKYRAFVLDGVEKGHREEFSGGGLLRSCQFLGNDPVEEAYDGRILGGGEFVQQLWDELKQERPAPALQLDAIIREVASCYEVESETLRHPSKRRRIADARAIICYIALRKAACTGVLVAKELNISPSGVTIAAIRGEAMA